VSTQLVKEFGTGFSDKNLRRMVQFAETFPNELPRRKQRGIKNFKFRHSALDAESSPVFWIPASAGMTNSPQAAGNTTLRDLTRPRTAGPNGNGKGLQ